MRDQSADSGKRTPARESDARTVYGGQSEKFNARIIGFTKEGDVILRVSPELSEELNQTLKTPSSITWNEPHRKMSTKDMADETKTSEPGTPRIGRPIHRSTSSVTVKGKERENATNKPSTSAIQDDDSVSNDSPTDIRDFKRAFEQKEYAYRWRSDVEKNLDESMSRASSLASRPGDRKAKDEYDDVNDKA